MPKWRFLVHVKNNFFSCTWASSIKTPIAERQTKSTITGNEIREKQINENGRFLPAAETGILRRHRFYLTENCFLPAPSKCNYRSLKKL